MKYGATPSPDSCSATATQQQSSSRAVSQAGRSARRGSRAKPGLQRPTAQRTHCAADSPDYRRCLMRWSTPATAIAGGTHRGEALLTLGDPEPVLRDAWAELRAEKDNGPRRLARLIDQRLRDENGLVRVVAVEPVRHSVARRRHAMVVRRARAERSARLA